MAKEENKKEGIGKCDYCDEEAIAFVRMKRLCEIHWWQFKRGELFILLKDV